MLTRRSLHSLQLLLLLYVSAGALNFNMFNRNYTPKEGDVRLSGSIDVSEGRVEVYHEGRWGTVCDDNFDMAEAQVVCRQLNFPGAKSVIIGRQYQQVSPPETPGPIWLDDINCKGTEKHLVNCEFKSWGETDCSHKEDVGVLCQTGSTNETINDSTHSLDHSISLSDDLGQIFDSGNGCDFLILVRSPTGNIQENGTIEMAETMICAHKIILSLFPLFSASGGISSITVDVSSSCQLLFPSFIRYIYTRKIDVTLSSAICVHRMASTFGVKQLMEDVGRLFSKVIPDDSTFHNQVSIYNYAVETGDLILKETCVQFLAWNYQNLTRSPAWNSLPVELLGALLPRSDLVAADEYFVLQSVERWITEQKGSISLEIQAELLSHIRFPMIPAEKLYDLESNSSLYSSHKNMYREKMLTAFQFNILLFSKLATNPKFSKDSADYQPRIYTAEPWGAAVGPSVNPFNTRRRYEHDRDSYYIHSSPSRYAQTVSFRTPIHSSLIFNNSMIYWQANIFKSQNECSWNGVRCESVPVAWLAPNYNPDNMLYRNRVVTMCKGTVCQVQGFKGNLAPIATNGTSCLCSDEQYTYRVVVRPEYV
ncbi:galectin-3-binding protein B-like isoform X2 [Salarias fasciatus]|uniref:galectin-3-binding protein B-like isoform X2 n=1 Tax=Salarias fasciatus TaxID=181472 RepID=UPI001176EEA4|nr:galectin-3-binding protein B-like isoform X2 [Salarias fasciatus]